MAATRHPIHRDAGLALLRVLFMRLLIAAFGGRLERPD